jgi:alanine dehydrogenase
MARTYLDAFCQVRKIKMVKVFSPNRKHVEDYAEEVSKRHGIKVEPSPSAREAVRGVDIVSICTSTNEPAFENEWLEPGMHVTNLTSADMKPDLPKVVDVAVRAGEATPRLAKTTEQVFYGRAGFLGYVAGDARERGLVPHVDLPAEILDMPTLIDVVAGRFGGRSSDAQTSFFLNVGAIGAQFEGVAAAVYHKAREQGLGREIPTEWFLQDVRD